MPNPDGYLAIHDRIPDTPASVGPVAASALQNQGGFLEHRTPPVNGISMRLPLESRKAEIIAAMTGLTVEDSVAHPFDKRGYHLQIRLGLGGGNDPFGHIPQCSCPDIPVTLPMISADPNCNFRMFQSCTIQYQPTPAQFSSLNLGAYIFLSTEAFPDPIAGGALFYYQLTCSFNQFSLTRIYPESPYGSPYRDGILYYWLVGGNGNTCSPFQLHNGVAFPGSDRSCSVKIN